MRIRNNHDSATFVSSTSMTRLAAMTGIFTACAVALGGACGNAQPTNTSGAGAVGLSGSSGDMGGMGGAGGSDLSVVAGSVTVGSVSASASSSGGGPTCPKADPNGGATKFAAAFGDGGSQAGNTVVYDKSGNIIVAGSYGGSINFGGTTLTSAGDSDIFVAKFSATGQLLWAKSFGDSNTQTASGVGVDANGNVYLTGNFKGTVNFGGGALTYAGVLFTDVYLAKFSSDGAHVFSKKFGDGNVQTVRGLSTDTAGNTIIVGSFQNDVNFGGATLTTAGDTDAFIAKFKNDGSHDWSRRYGDATNAQYARAVAQDAMGNVYIAGEVTGQIDFGGGAMPTMANPSAFVAKLDSFGNATWAKVSNGEPMSKAGGSTVAVAPNGNVAVGGYFRGKFDLGGMPVVNGGVDDAYVTVYSPIGGHLYTKTFGDSELQSVTAVEFSPENDVFIAGNFSGTIDLDSGEMRTSGGGLDGFLIRLDSKGCPKWMRTYSGPMAHLTSAMAIDPTTCGIALTGSFNGTVDLGTGTLTAVGDDVFIMSVNP